MREREKRKKEKGKKGKGKKGKKKGMFSLLFLFSLSLLSQKFVLRVCVLEIQKNFLCFEKEF